MVGRTPRVLAGVNPLDHDRTIPDLANPTKIRPRHGRLRKRTRGVLVRHRPDSRQDHIGKLHQATVPQKPGEPSWAPRDLWQKGKHGPWIPAEEFLDPIPYIALAHSTNRGIDSDHQRGKCSGPRSRNGLG